MRALHVTPYFAPAFRYGGPPRSILGLCRGLQRAGVEVEVFTTTANGRADLPASPPEGDRYDGVPVRYFSLGFPRRLFGARGLFAALRAGLRRFDIVHIHGLWTLPGWIAARAARRAGIPYVISPRGMLDDWSMSHRGARKRGAYWAVERRNLTGAAFLHATSAPEGHAIEKWAPHAPVVTLPNGVDLPAAAAAADGGFKRRWGLGPETPLVVFLGRLHPKKRLDLLAAAFARVRAAHPGVHLVIAGPDEAGQRRRVEPLLGAAGTTVHWVGELGDADKWPLLAEAAALVMCSDSESFGLSVLEAMAAGAPVVVTRTCPWEEVEAAGSGFWVPQTVDAIAEALLVVLRNPERARAMGDRGRILARSKYAWDPISRAMADRYRRVAAPVP